MDDPNAAQREFWTEGPGLNWIEKGDLFDANHANCLDILLSAADPRPGERVLDIGCGAGASTLAAAARVGPDGQATGLDISSPLVEHARRRASEAGVETAEFIVADAQVHAFENEFDLVLSRFGVMFFADTPSAFANLRRALRPDGRLAFIAWDGPDANPWFRISAERVADLLGTGRTPPAPDAPGPMRFAGTARVVSWLEAAGFRDVAVETRATTLDFPGSPRAAAEFAAIGGPAVRLLREAGAEHRAGEVTDGVEAAFAAYADGPITRVPASIHVFSGRA